MPCYIFDMAPKHPEDFGTRTQAIDISARKDSTASATSQPCLIVVDGPVHLLGQQWIIEQSVTLGRVEPAELIIAEPSISKSHARIVRLDGQVTINDLGSTNGTFVNDKRIGGDNPHALANNDAVKIGHVTFRYFEDGILSEVSEKERMRVELEAARMSQAHLFPPYPRAKYDRVRIAGRFVSATECCGDWWWHWSNGGYIFVIVADATGHGMGPALLTSAARSAVSTLEDDPNTRIERVYATLSNAIKQSAAKMRMTAFIVEIGIDSGEVRYINASHQPPALFGVTGEPVEWNNIEFLTQPTSSSLGEANPKFEVGSLETVLLSRLVIYTDGLNDRKDAQGRPISERRFSNLLIESQKANPDNQTEFIDSIFYLSNQQSANLPPDDDFTIVVVDF